MDINKVHVANINYVEFFRSVFASDDEVTVTVIDPNKGHFRTLLESVMQLPGEYTLIWDGRNDLNEVASVEGTYGVRVMATDPVTGVSRETEGNIMVFL